MLLGLGAGPEALDSWLHSGGLETILCRAPGALWASPWDWLKRCMDDSLLVPGPPPVDALLVPTAGFSVAETDIHLGYVL